MIVTLLFFTVVKQSFASTTAALLPISDGTYAQWAPDSGSTHYTRVDEASCNGNTDFNRETTVGQRDSYGLSLSTIPNGATITQIAITPCASKNTTGGNNSTFNVFYRLNGVNSADSSAYILTTTTPVVLSTTAYSGLATVKSGTTTLEIGGIYTAGNKGVKLSQVSTVITYTIPPSITTDAVATITQSTATLGSSINPNGINTTGNFKYGTSNVSCSTLPNTTSNTNVGSGTSNVFNNQGIASLSANTTYYYCATATNADGTAYGSVNSFTTLPNPPSVTTSSATSITQTAANLVAAINPNGASTTRNYRYGTSNVGCSSLPNATVSVNIGSSTSEVSPNNEVIASLSANTIYYFCATATNSSGTTYGSVLSFTTSPNVPTVTTNAADSIAQTTVNLNSTVNPNGSSATVNYLFGTSNISCSSLPNATGTTSIGSGISDVSPNARAIASLSANTTYYYCATATNVSGTSYGSVRSFTTLPNLPTVTTSSATSITQTTATLAAIINPNGVSTTRNYRYGTSNVGCASLPTVTGSINIGSGTSDVSLNNQGIASLSANTTYYFCATATNSSGTSYGNVLSFTTLAFISPSVTTNSATSISSSSALLNSTVNPNGLSTTVVYRYGTSNVPCTSLPSTTSTVSIGSGSTDVSPNSKTISLLSPSTTYYFCATASNVAGITYGSVNSFATLP